MPGSPPKSLCRAPLSNRVSAALHSAARGDDRCALRNAALATSRNAGARRPSAGLSAAARRSTNLQKHVTFSGTGQPLHQATHVFQASPTIPKSLHGRHKLQQADANPQSYARIS